MDKCGYCGHIIHGDIMMPEGEDPMHTDCWTEWVKEDA